MLVIVGSPRLSAVEMLLVSIADQRKTGNGQPLFFRSGPIEKLYLSYDVTHSVAVTVADTIGAAGMVGIGLTPAALLPVLDPVIASKELNSGLPVFVGEPSTGIVPGFIGGPRL